VLVLLGDRDVDAAADEQRQRRLGLGLEQLDTQVRVLLGERLERRDDERARGGLERRDAHEAAHVAGALGELGLDLLDARQQLVGARHERAAGVGQLEPPPDLAEEAHAGLALKLRELLGHRRGRERQRLGGARDRALGGELAEHGEAARIEHSFQIVSSFSYEKHRLF
jgi:hypothetical protein